MDAVLGLSMTRTRVGWVLVEGQDADGATFDHDEFTVRRTRGVRAVETAEQATAAVLQSRAAMEAHGQRLHAVGVTWSDDAAAEAALLLEFLTDAGLDNVVPIQFLRAAEELTRGIGSVIGSQRTAVCLIDGDSAAVVMISASAEGAQTAVKQAVGDDGLIRWLATTLDRASWQPDGVVVAGSRANLDAIPGRLENTLGIPVFVQAGAHVALARGAALSSAPSAEFTDTHRVETPGERRVVRGRSRPLTYAGGVAMLVAGAVTFVVSLSLAVGLHLAPDNGPAEQAGNTSATPPIARAAVSSHPGPAVP